MFDQSVLSVKFGRKEDLESLQKGQLYFNPIQKYRNDGTYFRGDANEGIVPIDQTKIHIKDGHGTDWFEDEKLPRPISVMESVQNDENTFIFCAAIISSNVLVPNDKNSFFVLNDKFKKAMRPFGDYALLFNISEIHRRLSLVRAESRIPFGYISKPIIYRNLTIFSKSYNHLISHGENNSIYDRYFIKDVRYKDQNEWRILIDGSKEPLVANCGDGYSIEIGKLDWSYLIKTSTFLNAFQYKDSDWWEI